MEDEAGLQQKIQDLLEAGTKVVWVARPVGPRRVEVYQPGEAMRVATAGEELRAPGILRNPVPVDALFDRSAAHEVVLRNLLQRRGYESLDQVRAEAQARALLAVFAARGLPVSDEHRARIRATTDLATLERWIARAVGAASVDEALG